MCSQNNAPCLQALNDSQGCPVPVGTGICGETCSMDIFKEFNRLYEEKMEQFDSEAGGDCLQEKIKLQQEWIRNLTQQNEFLVRAVQELEYEATDRVEKLEDKLLKTTQCLCEGEKMLQEKDKTVHELTQKINYFNTFGDVECMAKELQCRKEECESLKQDMLDIRESLTEEVAQKHDQIVLLKRDVLSLEERCVQADKQIAFKDDIIKELRKENKQLKQQFTQDEVGKLTQTIDELHRSLESTKFLQEEEERMHQKEMSQLQNTITALEEELKDSKLKYQRDSKVQANLESQDSKTLQDINEIKTKMKSELERKNKEIDILKSKVTELKAALNSCEQRAANLEDAVTSYSNSLKVLQTAEEEGKIQLQQQKITIANLQDALVQSKHETDEVRKKLHENDLNRQRIISMLEEILKEHEEEREFINQQSEQINKEYEELQELSFTLEAEHCDSLVDIELLETQLNKYKNWLRQKEIENGHIKEQLNKLAKQKKCYEEVVMYFKSEMGLMAEQLNNLQELLTLSTESAHQESCKIMQAFMDVQELNQKLSTQLCACEQKVQLENQMNQLQEAKICELQRLVQEKEMDLGKHDQAILNIRKTLNESLKQNENLQETVVQLNETIANLQAAVKRYEQENCESKRSTAEFQEQVGTYCQKLQELKRHLEEKTAECIRLEMAYNNEKRALKAAQKQLQETDKLQQENHKSLVNNLDDLKHKLNICNETNNKLCQECDNLQNQLANLSRKEAVKDLEIKRYRKIVADLKSTMMELNSELNKNLTQKELKGGCKSEKCRRSAERDDPKSQEICLSCPCEVEFYQKMIDMLKNSITELKQKLSESQEQNKVLEAEIRRRDKLLSDLQASKDELDQKLRQSQVKDKKIAELEKEIDELRQELQVKSLQLNDIRKSAQEINGSKCVQLACAQEEIANLKGELANVLNKQCSLKRENDELKIKTGQLICTVNCLTEENKMYKDHIEQNLAKIKKLNAEKDTLLRKNKELLGELRSLQSLTGSMDKQQRLTSQSVKQLEANIEDLKNNRNDICKESKNVIENVRAWVVEQKKINNFAVKREQEFLKTIKKLQNDVVDKTPPCRIQPRPSSGKMCRAKRQLLYGSDPKCVSPCSLGSQGTASCYDGESSPASPDVFSPGNDWYSSTFRADSLSENDDSEEDYCVNTLENLTMQMRQSNKIWKNENKAYDCRVTKDKK